MKVQKTYWNAGIAETVPTITRSYPYSKIAELRARLYAMTLGHFFIDFHRGT
jgi:hypothetical protein